jgi:uncharacterized protein (DUF2336 family)
MPIWSTRSPLETKTSKSPSRAARACSARFAAALAEVGTAEACLVLTRNCDAEIAEFSLDRVLERFGDAPAIREALLARNDLAPSTRLTMVTRISATLVDFVAARRWLDADHAQRIARGACEKATVTLAADTPATQMRSLVRHLRAGGALTAGLILRALLSGNVVLFEEALAELTEMPVERVSNLVYDAGNGGLRALFNQASLPPSTIRPSRRRSRRCARAAS